MKEVCGWHVGSVEGGKRRALIRASNGECVSVTQGRGGGMFTVVTFDCAEEVFRRMLENGGELADADALKVEMRGAVEVPAGLVDALLA